MNGVFFNDLKLSKFADQASAFAIDEEGKIYAWG